MACAQYWRVISSIQVLPLSKVKLSHILVRLSLSSLNFSLTLSLTTQISQTTTQKLPPITTTIKSVTLHHLSPLPLKPVNTHHHLKNATQTTTNRPLCFSAYNPNTKHKHHSMIFVPFPLPHSNNKHKSHNKIRPFWICCYVPESKDEFSFNLFF